MNPSFEDFAKLKGIHLLKDDIEFIKRMLNLIPYNERRATLQRYSEIWLSGIVNCDIVYRKQNAGRFAANTYLRELVDGREG